MSTAAEELHDVYVRTVKDLVRAVRQTADRLNSTPVRYDEHDVRRYSEHARTLVEECAHLLSNANLSRLLLCAEEAERAARRERCPG